MATINFATAYDMLLAKIFDEFDRWRQELLKSAEVLHSREQFNQAGSRCGIAHAVRRFSHGNYARPIPQG